MLKCHYGPVLVLFFLTMLASGFQCRPFFSRKRSNLLRDKCLVSRSAAESPAPAPPSVPVPKRKKRRIWHFINLTNGIELLHSLVHDCGVIPSAISFCRIQSSHCETCDFQAVLREIDHNLLLRLAMGDVVIIHDCSSRDLHWPDVIAGNENMGETESSRPLARGHPRAIWWGAEWVRYALCTIWNLDGSHEAGTSPGEDAGDDQGVRCSSARTWWLRGYNVNGLYREQMRKLPKSLRKRLKYYRNIVAAAGTQDVLLYGASCSTAMDGEREWYAEQLLQSERYEDEFEGLSHGAVAGNTRYIDSTHASYEAVLCELRADAPAGSDPANERFLPVIPPGSMLYCSADFVGVGRAASPSSSSHFK